MVVGRTRRRFSEEYKAQVVEAFLASGRSIAEVAQEYGLAKQTLREWVNQAADDIAGAAVTGQEIDPRTHAWAERCTSSAEYRAQVAAWYLSSRKTISEVAYTLNLSESTVREWVWNASPDDMVDHTPLPEWVTEGVYARDGSDFVPEVVEHEFRGQDAALNAAPDVEFAAQADFAAAHAGAAEIVARADAAEAAKALALAERKAAEAVIRAEAAADAEAAARAEIATAQAETATAYAVAVEAMLRAEVNAAGTISCAEAAAAEAVAQALTVAAEVRAAAAEAVARSEATLAEAVAHCEAAVAEAVAVAQSEVAARMAAEAAAREEIATVYAEAVEALVRTQAEAGEKVAYAEAAVAAAVAEAHASAAEDVGSNMSVAAGAVVHAEAVLVQDVAPAAAPSVVVTPAAAPTTPALAVVPVEGPAAAVMASDLGRGELAAPVEADALVGADDEAAARAKIAQLVSSLAPVEVWVQATGRTLAEAREVALDKLGVEEAEADIEVLAGSRWLPGRVRLRARIRVPHASVS